MATSAVILSLAGALSSASAASVRIVVAILNPSDPAVCTGRPAAAMASL